MFLASTFLNTIFNTKQYKIVREIEISSNHCTSQSNFPLNILSLFFKQFHQDIIFIPHIPSIKSTQFFCCSYSVVLTQCEILSQVYQFRIFICSN